MIRVGWIAEVLIKAKHTAECKTFAKLCQSLSCQLGVTSDYLLEKVVVVCHEVHGTYLS